MRTWAAAVVALGLACTGALGVPLAACGSSSSGFGSGDDPSSRGDGGSAKHDASTDDAGAPDDTPSSVFNGGGDGGGPTSTLDCKPGTYEGTFSTQVSEGDAGGIFSIFSIAWSGTLSITLQAVTTMDNSGELPTTTLTIAPGAKVDGTDAYGGHFTADLSGQLDCPSRALVGTLANGNYAFPYASGDAGGIVLTGSLSGSYDSTVTPPALNGAIMVSSPQVPMSVADGTWKATLQ